MVAGGGLGGYGYIRYKCNNRLSPARIELREPETRERLPLRLPSLLLLQLPLRLPLPLFLRRLLRFPLPARVELREPETRERAGGLGETEVGRC